MARPRSEKVVAWLEQFLAVSGEGNRLPTDTQLARGLGVSVRTVSSVMASYRSRGLIERTPGSGTCVAGRTRPARPAIPAPRSSAQNLAAQLESLISSGGLRRGQALPQTKYTGLQFRVSQQTVAAAYRELAARGLVSRVGRSYWVGSGPSLLHDRKDATVVVVKYRSDDFTDVFSTDMYAPAYRACESELVSAGYRLDYCSSGDLPRFLVQARTTGLAGLLFVSMSIPEALSVLEANRQLLGRLKERGARFLIDCRWKNTPEERDLSLQRAFDRYRENRAMWVMQRGHLYTSVARALAHHLVESGHRRVTVFLDEQQYRPFDWTFITVIRIRTELQRLDDTCRFRLVISPANAALDTREYLERHTGTQAYFGTQSEARLNLSKYGGVNPRVLFSECTVTTDLASAYGRPTNGDAWVFVHDNEADRALEWCRANRLRVPRDVSIVGLQNDPRHYHRGISACCPDWRTTGYLMAHAIIGDVPVARTAKGYLGTSAAILQRRTTV